MKKILVIMVCFLPLFSAAQEGFDWNLKAGAYNRVENDQSYIVASFKPYFQIDKFFGALDLEFAFDPDGTLKQDDWDNTKKITEKITLIGYGDPEQDPFFFRFGMLDDISLGFGILVNRFRNDIYYPQIKKTGFFGGFDVGATGLSFFVEDSYDLDFFGGRLFVRPLNPLEDPSIPAFIKNLEFGISFVMDKDPYNQDTSATGYYLADDSSQSVAVKAFALDMAFPLIEGKNFSLDNYVQYGDLVDAGAGIGYGFRGRFFTFMGYKTELSYNWDGFIPGYFSSFYGVRDVRKNRFDEASASEDGFGYLLGFYVEALKKQLLSGLEYTDSPAEGPQLLFYVYMKPEVIKRLYLKFNYSRKDIDGIVDAFDIKSLKGNTMILLELGYEITTNAAISIRYIENFQEVDGVVSGKSMTEIQTTLLF